jgi:hypothetical protein
MDEVADLKRALDVERKKRTALADMIAGALAALDPDPDPEILDRTIQYCRICRLLLERYRGAAALVEHDPEQLAEAGTWRVVVSLHDDLKRHVQTSGHDPLVEAVQGLLDCVGSANPAH